MVRGEMGAMETRLRNDLGGDMKAMETGIRGDMKAMETGIRGDMKAMEDRLRSDLGGDMKVMEDRLRSDLGGDMKAMEDRLERVVAREVAGSVNAMAEQFRTYFGALDDKYRDAPVKHDKLREDFDAHASDLRLHKRPAVVPARRTRRPRTR